MPHLKSPPTQVGQNFCGPQKFETQKYLNTIRHNYLLNQSKIEKDQ